MSTLDLSWIAKKTLPKKNKILRLVKKHKTPFFAYDKPEFVRGIGEFRATFREFIPQSEFFFAMKSNPHPWLLQEATRQGFGIDASSGREVKLAQNAGSKRILFTGPGKSDEELAIAFKYSKNITLHIDSFTEFEKLKTLSEKFQKKIDFGVRINTSYHGRWNKFGIPLRDLDKLWKLCLATNYIVPVGIQVHMSWNEDARPYKNVIGEIGKYLKENQNIYQTLSFIDLGGGFLTHNLQGIYKKSAEGGNVSKHKQKSSSLDEYARGIQQSIDKCIEKKDITYYFEPGRVISAPSMHIVLSVADVKNKTSIITDGGSNIVGWIENDYWPIVNITNPSNKEIRCNVWGSLCTPEDIWGYYVFAKKIEENDVLVIPYQGAYTYTHAQAFIKEFPRVYQLQSLMRKYR